MSIVRLLCVSTLTAMVVMSCALPPPVPDAVVTDTYADSQADEVLKKVNADYTEAMQEGLDFFAPNQFREGKAALSKAARLRRSKAEDMEILKQLYVAEKQLKICRQVKMQAEKQMPDVLGGLQTLEAKSATQSYPDEYYSVTHGASKLLRDIEDGVLGKPVDPKKNFAEEKAKLLQEMHKLEIKVVKYNTLNDSKIVFKEVVSIGGKRLAPKTFKKAEKTLKEANAIIENNVKDDDVIAEAGKKYEFAVFHALHVARAVDKLESLSRSEYETYILDLEEHLQAIADAFEYRDIRNHALNEQMQLLTGLAKRLMTQKANIARVNRGAVQQEQIDVTQLEEDHENALKRIQELSDQLTQVENNQAPDTVSVSQEEQKLKKKASQLEQQVSELLLKYNNLKAERDSLQNKLNATRGK
ncbi:hypothetical protein [Kaarinaea lacus]